MQASENQCPECGEVLSDEAPRGLCPKCLLNQGLESTATHGFVDDMRAEPDRDSRQGLQAGERFGDYEICRLLGKGGIWSDRQQRDDLWRALVLEVLATNSTQ